MKIGVNASGLCWSVPPSGVPTKLVNLTKTFVPAVIRGPGGTLGNYATLGAPYTEFYGTPAKDADGLVSEDLLEYAQNDEAYMRRYGTVSTHFLDFYIDLCKRTGAEALWVANLDNISSAVGAIKRIRQAGVPLLGVEGGNERWLLKYGEDVNSYIAACAMLRADMIAGGHEAVPFSMCVKIGGGRRLQEWNAAVIASGLTDRFAVHLYQDTSFTLTGLATQYQSFASLNRTCKFWLSEVGSQLEVPDMNDIEHGLETLRGDAQADLLCYHNLTGDGDHGLIKESRGWFGGNQYAVTSYGKAVRKLLV